MSKLNVGLIGCGRIAQLKHLRILTSHPTARLAALAEPDEKRRILAGQRAGEVSCFTDYRDLLDRSEVDAVVICLPTELHAEAAIAAFQAGKHVYLEKPIATDRAAAQAVYEAWQQAGTVGMIGFNFRFDPLFQQARETIRTGALGELLAVRSIFSTISRPLPVWKQHRSRGGGVLLDLASHHVDLLHFLFDEEVEQVWATLSSLESEGDNATVQFRLRSGLTVQSLFSSTSREENRFEIYGSRQKLTVDRLWLPDIDLEQNHQPRTRRHRLMRLLYPRRLLHTPDYEGSFRTALSAFIEAASNGQQVPPTLLDGYRSLLVVEAAEASARSNCLTQPAPVVVDGKTAISWTQSAT